MTTPNVPFEFDESSDAYATVRELGGDRLDSHASAGVAGRVHTFDLAPNEHGWRVQWAATDDGHGVVVAVPIEGDAL
jgi:hypothetical protein